MNCYIPHSSLSETYKKLRIRLLLILYDALPVDCSHGDVSQHPLSGTDTDTAHLEPEVLVVMLVSHLLIGQGSQPAGF